MLRDYANNDFSVWCVIGLCTTGHFKRLNRMLSDYSTSLQLLHASLGLNTAVKELKQEPFLDEIRLKLERRVALTAQVF